MTPAIMKSRRRRGFTLIEILAMLPLVAAIFGVVYYVTMRSVEYQTLELADQADRTVMRDIVRRIQDEAPQATSATMEGGELALTLRQGRSVTYRVDGDKVTRTEESADGARMAEYGWSMKRVSPRFSIERTNSAEVIWMTFERSAPRSQGPDQTMLLSAAASVGRAS